MINNAPVVVLLFFNAALCGKLVTPASVSMQLFGIDYQWRLVQMVV
ncbi:MAG: hypothetical protein IPK31_03800 [Chitinophagaceae bacterium]|nr:hypothetical protein [Chitinophagaceae bacterium]